MWEGANGEAMNDGTFDGTMSVINGHKRTGFIARDKFRTEFLLLLFLCRQEKKRVCVFQFSSMYFGQV